MFGNPTVQSSVGPFANALIFDAVSGYDQIELPVNVAGSGYDIQYDVMSHNLLNSLYAFTILLDTPLVHTVSLDGHQNTISVFQPSPYTDENLGFFSDDQVYHFDISVNLQSDIWSLSLDGTQIFSNPYDATGLEDIRFSMDPAIFGVGDAPGTFAALDNVVINVTPEQATGYLPIVSLAPVFLLYHRRRREIHG